MCDLCNQLLPVEYPYLRESVNGFCVAVSGKVCGAYQMYHMTYCFNRRYACSK